VDSFIYGSLADDPDSNIIVRSGRDHPARARLSRSE